VSSVIAFDFFFPLLWICQAALWTIALLQSGKEFHHFSTCCVKNQVFFQPCRRKGILYCIVIVLFCNLIQLFYNLFGLLALCKLFKVWTSCGFIQWFNEVLSLNWEFIHQVNLETVSTCWALSGNFITTFVNDSSWVRAHCFVRWVGIGSAAPSPCDVIHICLYSILSLLLPSCTVLRVPSAAILSISPIPSAAILSAAISFYFTHSSR